MRRSIHSFLAVPILRGGDVLGVLTVQNKTHKEYSDEDVEVLETTAMVLAEHLVSGDVAGVNTAAEFSRAVSHVVQGEADRRRPRARPRRAAREPRRRHRAEFARIPEAETRRLETAVDELKTTLDEILGQGDLAASGEHREVFEAYRMFAHDRGWLRRMKEAIKKGLTAEAAVERVQNDTRASMLGATRSLLARAAEGSRRVVGAAVARAVGRSPVRSARKASCRRTRSWLRAPWGPLICSTTIGRASRAW